MEQLWKKEFPHCGVIVESIGIPQLTHSFNKVWNTLIFSSGFSDRCNPFFKLTRFALLLPKKFPSPPIFYTKNVRRIFFSARHVSKSHQIIVGVRNKIKDGLIRCSVYSFKSCDLDFVQSMQDKLNDFPILDLH